MKKVAEILGKIKKGMLKDLEGARERLSEIGGKIAASAKKAKDEAKRIAKIGELKLDITYLTRRRNRKLQEIEKKTHLLAKDGKASEKGLKLIEEITNLTAMIRKEEEEIKKVKKRDNFDIVTEVIKKYMREKGWSVLAISSPIIRQAVGSLKHNFELVFGFTGKKEGGNKK